ncbi:hypothetical protein Nepgr_004719 [Nepenthes gracilis]|uniref:Protein FAR1-RELATED SEQUENCE n=1 Tax=Nepenthes gracilis TaxID=150966 RepID=A0AAD3XFL2_NEPGR|nr:hypothetical protein Nepgr_004719 [Nepenthes gracilis]
MEFDSEEAAKDFYNYYASRVGSSTRISSSRRWRCDGAIIQRPFAAGLGRRRIMSVVIKEYGGVNKVGLTEVDCRNYVRNNEQRNMEGDIQLLIDYLKEMNAENPNFFYAVLGDDDHSTGNVFWAVVRERINYTHFGDTVTFDKTYRCNPRDNQWAQSIYSARGQWVLFHLISVPAPRSLLLTCLALACCYALVLKMGTLTTEVLKLAFFWMLT